ncbi:MAG: hypothetical protein D6719_03210 [Candidatus Dadabacteria bacterium]|nr:MAG: hypothetical protein D6719_03210 [Candidatus Dadabacteria bacterium]
MREKVSIVLNEREPLKRKTAEMLVAQLAEINITASRIEIDENIETVICERLPRVLVLDYLLGDYSTGLDVMHRLSEIDVESRPLVIFLTDEPSVQVAVDAMRMGAYHYIELDNPRAVSLASREIERLLKSEPTAQRRLKNPPKINDLVATSKQSRLLIKQLQAIIAKRSPVVLICGPAGSGVTTLAKALQEERSSRNPCRKIDLRFFTGTARDALGISHRSGVTGRVGSNLSLIIEHLEEDDGELLDFLIDNFEDLWGNVSVSNNDSFLTLCTSDTEISAAWAKAIPLEMIKIPALQDRSDDIPALIQRFVQEAVSLSSLKIKPLSAQITAWVSELDWPGDIKQLRSCVLNALIMNTLDGGDLKELINEQRNVWEENNSHDSNILPDPFTAAATLERCGHRYRPAAALLGCGIRKLQTIIDRAISGGE